MADGQMNIRAKLDLSDLERKAARYGQAVRQMGVVTDEQGRVMSTAWTRMKQAASAYLTMDIVKRIAQTRGEFQQLEVAFNTLLGSQEKSASLMSQLVETAAKTPFDLKGIADGARQLLAYGFAAEDVNDTLIRLGNVASGLGLPLERLTYLYGTTAVQGRLYARDMLQFQSSGIPVLQGLADMYGKTTSEINDMVTAGKIGFEDVRKVIEQMTNEGGKFYNLMEEQSKTITGQISNLGDAIDMMFNNIGKANEGAISDVISGATYLVENYEKVLSILKVLVATYGTYKASLIAVAAAQRVAVTIQNISSWLSLAKTIRTAKDAQIAFNLATKANPYVLLATLIIGVGTALYQFTKKTDAAKEALKEFNDEADRQTEKYRNLISVAQDESKATYERQQALEELKQIYPAIFKNMDLESLKTANQTKLTNDLAKAERERQRLKAEEDVASSQKNVDELQKKLEAYQKNSGKYGQLGIAKVKNELSDAQRILEGNQAVYKQITQQIQAQEEAEKRAAEEAKKREESVEKTVKWYEEQIKTLKEAQETSTTSKQFNDYQKQIDQLTKEKEAITGASKATQKAEEERIKTIKQINEELLSLRKQNQQEQIDLMQEGTEKELAQIRLDYQEKIAEIKKLADKWAAEQGGTLTSEQTIQVSTAFSEAKQQKQKAETEMHKAEMTAMRDYLKEYGTFQQQKLAIAEEYAEKIRKAQNEGEKLTLQEEEKKAINQINTQAIKADIDWATVFGEFGGMFRDIIEPTLEKAKKYTQTDEFKNSDAASQKDLIDAINQMEKSFGSVGTLNFKKLGQDIQAYQQSIRELDNAKQEEIKAIENLKKAQEDYNKVIKNGTEQEKIAAEESLKNAQDNVNATSEYVKSQETIARNNQQMVSSSAARLSASMGNVTEGLAKLASGGLKNAYDGLIQAGKGIGGAMSKVADNLESVPIVGWILSIIDILKDGLSNLVGSLLDSILQAVAGIISDVLSGDLIKTIVKSITGGIGKILDAITFGGFNSWISSSNAKEVAKTTEQLTSSNERLKNAVDNLKDEMSKTGGWKAIDSAKQAKKDQETINKQTMGILRTQMGYHGSHHSNAYYWGLGGADYASINKNLADYLKKNPLSETIVNSVGSLEDIYKLTPEQMDYIRTYNIEMWEKMLDQGKYDKKEYWENYADLAGQMEEITDSLKETLTQITFDSLRSSFVDSLMDMNKSAEDFADDFQEYMMRSILNAKISDLLDKELKKFYDTWANYAESGNEITQYEQNELSRQWDEITKKGLAIRDQVASFTGYDNSEQEQVKSQTGTISEKLTEETASEMMGIWRGQYDTLKGIYTVNSSFYESYKSTMAICNGILNQIADNTGRTAENTTVLSGMSETLSRMDGRLRTLESNSNKKYI